ncbi:pre-mRNA-splicing factor CWC25 homolog [Danaus plexippus]|uniref:pre-mRNA-splicing factor CWC25 homolog n=1 Tax=Danaus plexippus TaxID=13037 RepID=UPI002AB0B7D7|nr:pre-mRNA-splicing factor CWC25 homolog [Danaus plexippus]
MGGGDLNTKKAWHPSNLKNQERVWKAEQAAAAEKKRIEELERERAQERDREELNALSRQNVNTNTTQENRLHWMYDKPDKQVQQEDYLLGKAIDKNYDQGDKQDQNEIPAVSRRVVGSSMMTAGGDVQVDLARKLREDPLLLVKERERAARAALLNNPIQRRKLTELLRKEQEKKILKKKSKKSNIDELLASKLSALAGEKSMNLAKLLDSDSSSSDSSSSSSRKKKTKKKKKKMSKHKSKKHQGNDSDEKQEKSKKSKDKKKHKDKKDKNDDSDAGTISKREKYHNDLKFDDKKYPSSMKRKSHVDSDGEPQRKSRKSLKEVSPYQKRNESYSQDRYRRSSGDRNRSRRETENDDRRNSDRRGPSRSRSRYDQKTPRDNQRSELSQDEKAAKLAAMVQAGAEREIQRGRRVAEQLAEKAAEDTTTLPRSSHKNQARTLPDSLESRIHSNRHNIQRDKRHMNEHFARR